MVAPFSGWKTIPALSMVLVAAIAVEASVSAAKHAAVVITFFMSIFLFWFLKFNIVCVDGYQSTKNESVVNVKFILNM